MVRLNDVIIVGVTILPFLLLGWGFARPILDRCPGIATRLLRFACAVILGVPAGTMLLVALLAIHRPGSAGLVGMLAVLGAIGIGIGLSRIRRTRTAVPAIGTTEAPRDDGGGLAATVMAALVLILVLIPLANVGRETPEGFAFRAYFSSDYLKHVAMTEEVARLQFPPTNPYFAPERLHYYWLFYIVPAVAVRFGAAALASVMVYHVVLDCCFLILLWELVRTWSTLRPVRLWIYGSLLFATSLEGVYVFLHYRHCWTGLVPFISRFNIDGATRWLIGHPQVDCFYRTMLFTPQHLLGLTFLMLILWTDHAVPGWRESRLASLFRGALAGFTFLWSAIIGLVVILWVGLMAVLAMMERPFSPRRIDLLILTGVPIGLATGISLVSGMTVPNGSPLLPVWIPILPMLAILFLNFGFLLVLGLAALVIARDQVKAKYREFFLLLIALPFGFYVQIRDYPSDIGLKAGLVVIVALAALAAACLDSLSSRLGGTSARWGLHLGLSGMILLSLPTVLIDGFNSQDIGNRGFTSFVTQADMAACRWIRANLPESAVIQANADTREDRYSIVPTFAGRRSVIGDLMHGHIFQTPMKEFISRRQAVSQIYATWNPLRTLEQTHALGIEYLFVGQAERLVGRGVDKFGQCPQLFSPIYHDAGVDIYRVRPDDATLVKNLRIDRTAAVLTADCFNPDLGRQMMVRLVPPRTAGRCDVDELPRSPVPPGRSVKLSVSLAGVDLSSLTEESVELAIDFPAEATYPGGSLSTRTGKSRPSQEKRGETEMVSDSAANDFLVRTPSEWFPPGAFTTGISIRAERPDLVVEKPEEIVAVLDAFVPAENRPLVSKEVTWESLQRGHQYLSFYLIYPMMLEFRVRQTGIVKLVVGQIDYRGVEPPVSIFPGRSLDASSRVGEHADN